MTSTSYKEVEANQIRAVLFTREQSNGEGEFAF